MERNAKVDMVSSKGSQYHPCQIHQPQAFKDTKRLVDKIANRTYKATLVLAPLGATNVWKSEIARFFPDLKVKYYLLSPSRARTISEQSKTLEPKVFDL